MTDLFEHIETLPIDVQNTLQQYSNDCMNYNECRILVNELNKLGYTCEYGLDAMPFNLTKI